VKHEVTIACPPSVVFQKLADVGSIKEWAPVVMNSSCIEDKGGEGTLFAVDFDLKQVGGPKFHFDNVVAESVRDRKVVWRQTKGPMKELAWLFELTPTEREATKVAATIEYKMPYSILGRLMDKLKMNRVIDGACSVNLYGLKIRLEGTAPAR
jgi:ribosome-associated toxin RatA of RatAB toxin-antitoxin module